MKNLVSHSLILFFLFTALLFLSAYQTANAAFIRMNNTLGEAVVYDDMTGLYWMQPAEFIDLNYSDQMAKIDYFNSINYYGISDWQMANFDETNNLFLTLWNYYASTYQSFLDSFDVTYVDPAYAHYDGRISNSSGSSHLRYRFKLYPNGARYNAYSWINDANRYVSIGAWVNYTPVPLPAAVWLLVLGLVGMIGFVSGRKN
ncbi:MAG: hypothetical protein GXP22_06420 [Gammaproteobacteria bacterium]|nr:hypothetical protein [Gammaproteobacteria bacterium]